MRYSYFLSSFFEDRQNKLYQTQIQLTITNTSADRTNNIICPFPYSFLSQCILSACANRISLYILTSFIQPKNSLLPLTQFGSVIFSCKYQNIECIDKVIDVMRVSWDSERLLMSLWWHQSQERLRLLRLIYRQIDQSQKNDFAAFFLSVGLADRSRLCER